MQTMLICVICIFTQIEIDDIVHFEIWLQYDDEVVDIILTDDGENETYDEVDDEVIRECVEELLNDENM